jgi:chromosome partitioning protein
MSKVIAVASERGGVGRTSVATNLAQELSEKSKRVLLLDLDPQADSSRELGFKTDYSIANLYNKSKNIADIVHKVENSTLFLIPSNIKLLNIEKIYKKSGSEFRLREVVDYLRKKFDYIVFDLPPYLGHITITAISNSDTVLSPIRVEKTALHHISKLSEVSDLLQKKLQFVLTNSGELDRKSLSVIENELRPQLLKLGKKSIIISPRKVQRDLYQSIIDSLF